MGRTLGPCWSVDYFYFELHWNYVTTRRLQAESGEYTRPTELHSKGVSVPWSLCQPACDQDTAAGSAQCHSAMYCQPPEKT